MALRSHSIGEISSRLIGEAVILCGWVGKRRDLGGIIFIELRDRYGTVQCTFDPEESADAHRVAEEFRPEYVVRVMGTLRQRPQENRNPKVHLGDLEVVAKSAELFTRSLTPPFYIAEESGAEELLRMQYRYLDLRRPSMLKNIITRHQAVLETRNYLHSRGFIEVETPILAKSTPEGARDFLVPSRDHRGSFYALPQSPQIFKQLLMVSGLDKYFQICRCFRDEDLRADRQPEHSQIDIEMSFAEEEDVFELNEGLMKRLWGSLLGIEIETPFPRMRLGEAWRRFGSDKPDVRFGMEIRDMCEPFRETKLSVLRERLDAGDMVAGISVPEVFSRKRLDDLEKEAKELGAKGLLWIVAKGSELSSPIAKHLSPSETSSLQAIVGESGTLIMIADRSEVALEILGQLRVKLGKEHLSDSKEWKFLWVREFPLFEKDKKTGTIQPSHHPFTRPLEPDTHKLQSDPLTVLSHHYDLVLNGTELGSGSLRIHEPDLQREVFKILGYSDERIEDGFGFMLKAFEYGVPPHGGIALGLDRIIMMMVGGSSIRDVIAFPKTTSAQDPMSGAPGQVDDDQLRELGITLL